MARKWWILAAVACGTFMATLDSSIVNIALPTLTKELGPDLHRVKWVVIIYLLAITCLLLPFGRLSDQFGRKSVFQMGFVIFVAGSLACGLSPTLVALVAARALQALGASMLMANGPAIITAAFPSTERGRALGILAMVVSAGLISGPSVGGVLISALGWRSIFLINIPIGILGAALVHHHLADDPPNPVKAPFDWAGAVIQTFLLLAFIVIFDPPNVSISGSIPFEVSRWLIVLVILILGAIFIKIEKDAAAPLLDLSLLEDRVFWTGNLASFLTFVSYSTVAVLMPFFLEEVMHFRTHLAGVFMTAIPLIILIVAPIAGRLSDRFGSRELSFLGAMIGAVTLFAMAGVFGPGIDGQISRPGIVLGLGMVGLATGLFQSPNNSSIMGSVPAEKLGVASALLATMRNLGLVTGTGLATTLFSWRLEATGDFVEALHTALIVGGIIGLGAAVASLGKGRRQVPLLEVKS